MTTFARIVITKSEKPMHLKIILTEDGSHSLYNGKLDEIYHSTHGALAESRHVYLEAGFDQLAKSIPTIRLLEVGFGTGLNALLTADSSILDDRKVEYLGLEPYPLKMAVMKKLNYPGLFPEHGAAYWNKIHQAGGEHWTDIHANFSLKLKKEKIEHVELPSDHFHLIYFDAFAPDVQPELWSKAVFQKLFGSLQPGGLVVTYSARGSVRRNMQEAGFRVERLPGPAGKKEMLRAMKPITG